MTKEQHESLLGHGYIATYSGVVKADGDVEITSPSGESITFPIRASYPVGHVLQLRMLPNGIVEIVAEPEADSPVVVESKP